MTLGGLDHLSLGALDVLVPQVLLVHEPVVLVPPDEEPDVLRAEHFVLVDLAENFPSSFSVEQANNNPGILELEVPHYGGRVVFEDLSVDDGDVLLLGLLLQVVQGGEEDLLRLLDDGDAGPLEPVEDLHPGGVVDRGRGVSSEECGEPLPVREGRTGGSVADGDEVPLTGGLG